MPWGPLPIPSPLVFSSLVFVHGLCALLHGSRSQYAAPCDCSSHLSIVPSHAPQPDHVLSLVLLYLRQEDWCNLGSLLLIGVLTQN